MTHILIIEARFYEDIADMLLGGAVSKLESQGASFDIISVPGCFEIPAALSIAYDSKRYDGYVVLGAVIRGETGHYDYVCSESIRGINQLAMEFSLAVGNGILTTENEAQAITRADINQLNKGGFAAKAALHMIRLKIYFANLMPESDNEPKVEHKVG